jgi:hypothetical protein
MPRENQPNPDVNWQIIDDEYDTEKPPDKGKENPVKQPEGDEGIIHPDTDESEEPPGSDEPPMGDVDDSPKRIAGESEE